MLIGTLYFTISWKRRIALLVAALMAVIFLISTAAAGRDRKSGNNSKQQTTRREDKPKPPEKPKDPPAARREKPKPPPASTRRDDPAPRREKPVSGHKSRGSEIKPLPRGHLDRKWRDDDVRERQKDYDRRRGGTIVPRREKTRIDRREPWKRRSDDERFRREDPDTVMGLGYNGTIRPGREIKIPPCIPPETHYPPPHPWWDPYVWWPIYPPDYYDDYAYEYGEYEYEDDDGEIFPLPLYDGEECIDPFCITLPAGDIYPWEVGELFLSRLKDIEDNGYGALKIICIVQMQEEMPYPGFVRQYRQLAGEIEYFETLSSRAFLLAVPVTSVLELLVEPEIRWIGEYAARYKLVPGARNNHLFVGTLRGDEKEFRQELAALGLDVIEYYEEEEAYFVKTTWDCYDDLADLWWVKSVSPLSDKEKPVFTELPAEDEDVPHELGSGILD